MSVVSFNEHSILPSDIKIRVTYIYCYKANKYWWNFPWKLLTFREVDSVSSMLVVLEDLGSFRICNCSSCCIAINIKVFGGLADSLGHDYSTKEHCVCISLLPFMSQRVHINSIITGGKRSFLHYISCFKETIW